MSTPKPRILLCVSLLLAAPCAVPGSAGAANTPGAASAHDLRLVAHHDLSGRPAYMPHVQEQGGHWILYVAHHTGAAEGARNGTSILDVTDPARPTLLAHVPGGAPPDDEARSVRACTFPNGKTYLLRSVGQSRYEVFETTDPANPSLKVTIGGDYTYTHKINWECDTGIAYLPTGNASGTDPGSDVVRWKREAERLNVWRIRDPGPGLQVEFVRSFGLPGMLARSSLPSPTNIHHAIVDRERRRLHIGYGCCGSGIYQVVDRARLLDPAHLDSLEYPSLGVFPQASPHGVHTAYPLNGFVLPSRRAGDVADVRDLAIVVGEAIGNECASPRQMVRVFDVSALARSPGAGARPTVLASWSLPAAPADRCPADGWFGPHSTNESYTEPFYGKLLAVAYFGGGLRMVDIRDPLHPREVAHYVPGARTGTIQTNNAEVDRRGFVYVVDRRGAGLDILELTGQARKILAGGDDRPAR